MLGVVINSLSFIFFLVVRFVLDLVICLVFVFCWSNFLLGIMDVVLFLCWDNELFKVFERILDVLNVFIFIVVLFVFFFGYFSSVKGYIMFLYINFLVGVGDMVVVVLLVWSDKFKKLLERFLIGKWFVCFFRLKIFFGCFFLLCFVLLVLVNILELDIRIVVWVCWSVIFLCFKLFIIVFVGVLVLRDLLVLLIIWWMFWLFCEDLFNWFVFSCCILLEVVYDFLSFLNRIWGFFIFWMGNVLICIIGMGRKWICNGIEM